MPANTFAQAAKVVKGQISNYYIPTTHERMIKGIVTDAKGHPLEGATVMFFASPIHCNTDIEGRFELKGSDDDRHLYVYYHQKKLYNQILQLADNDIHICMTSAFS